jgi:Predicted membrane protein (DUF2231)
MLFLAFSTLFGLPGHALLVHAAVVLVPLAAVALAAIGWRADWRKAYSLPVAIIAAVGAIFAFLAKQSGGPLRDSIEQAARAAGVNSRLGEHPEQGDTAFVFAMFFGVAAVAFWAIDRYRERFGLPTWFPLAAYVGAVGVGALATLTMMIAGHSGATLVWKDVGTFASSR